ncbi:hypothetical protein V1477_014493 [Vespula maculifrons]|uniref:Uncharacterized protein n=1 Tax=Vespula maculifrons TaxID=7453 RepID=A0ABD2BHK7_VESMC
MISHLNSICPPKHQIRVEEYKAFFESCPAKFIVPIDDKAVKISEVISITKNLKINKSPAYDLIRVKMVKVNGTEAIRFIIILTNVIFSIDHFLQIWIRAEIILLHKGC